MPTGDLHSVDAAAHTRLPNLLLSFAIPRLDASCVAVLLHIMRQTSGFADPENPGRRKQWDRISMSQFVDGITTEDGVVLDFGCGLTRNAVRKALNRLVEHDLIAVRFCCPVVVTSSNRTAGCGWDQDEETGPVNIDERTGSASCPKCKRSLSRRYSVRTVTPGAIARFLDATDPDGRTWKYHPSSRGFRPVTAEQLEQMRQDDRTDLERQAADLRAQLWFPELADQIVGQANSALKSKRMALTRLISGFYEPLLRWQNGEDARDDGVAPPRAAVEYALRAVIDNQIAARKRSDQGVYNYARACAASYVTRGQKGRTQQAAREASAAINVQGVLERCAELNENGEGTRAEQLLQEQVLTPATLDSLASQFDGDRALARRHLLEAFKRGTGDYRNPRRVATPFDFLPSFDWADDERDAAQAA